MPYSNEEIIKALDDTHGMIFLASQKLGCTPKTIYRRAEKVRAVRDVIDSHRGKLLDTAELKLEQAILAGEQWAINLALKTIGKHRGYTERQEISGPDGGPIDAVMVYIPDNGRGD